MLRAIREIKPRWIIGENVYGLVNWSEGLVFDEVQSDLEAEGFEVFPYVLPAASVNAPHKRDRVWFVAHRTSERLERSAGKSKRRNNTRFAGNYKQTSWQTFPTVSPVCDGNDGLSNRLDSITFSKWRNESIKAGGNAVVPQVVYQLFKTIEAYEQYDRHSKTKTED